MLVRDMQGEWCVFGTIDRSDTDETRGQWPYRPAATRAMRNRLVVPYDLN